MTFSVNLTHSPSCVGSAARRVLDEVDEGLGVHAGVVLAYGARSVSHLDTFDAGDIKTAADNFRAAGVAPLQCKWIMTSLTDRVAAGREAPPRRQRHRTALQAARENKCRRRHRRCRPAGRCTGRGTPSCSPDQCCNGCFIAAYHACALLLLQALLVRDTKNCPRRSRSE